MSRFLSQSRMISAGSWAMTILVLLGGFWLRSRFGSATMWTALILFLALVVVLGAWLGGKAARKRLEFQELISQLAGGRSIEEIAIRYPDFLPTLRAWPDETIEDVLEALDEEQADDLRRFLRRPAHHEND